MEEVLDWVAYAAITRAKERVYLSWPLQHQTRALSRAPFLKKMALAALPEAEAEKDGSDETNCGLAD